MFGTSRKIKELEDEIAHLQTKYSFISVNIEALRQHIASMRGMLNRKLYSGKLEAEEPDWLTGNLKLLGGIEKDKKPDVVGI